MLDSQALHLLDCNAESFGITLCSLVFKNLFMFYEYVRVYQSAFIIYVPSYTREVTGVDKLFEDLPTTMQIYSVYRHSLRPGVA